MCTWERSDGLDSAVQLFFTLGESWILRIIPSSQLTEEDNFRNIFIFLLHYITRTLSSSHIEEQVEIG